MKRPRRKKPTPPPASDFVGLEVHIRPRVTISGPDSSEAECDELAVEILRDVGAVLTDYVKTLYARLSGRYSAARIILTDPVLQGGDDGG